MITEDQVVALFAKSNPIPTLDDLDAVETIDTESLMSLPDRSSIVSNQKPIEKKMPEPGRRPLVAVLAMVVLAVAVAVPLLLKGNGGRGVAAPTTVPITAPPSVRELGPDGSNSSARLQLNMPDGWTRHGWYASNGLDQPNWMALAFGSVGNIYADRCLWQDALLDPPLGPTVDDLATAVAEHWGSYATAPIDIMLGGFAGKYTVVTVPIDVVFANCDSRQFRGMINDAGGERYYQGPGQIDEWWILDIGGDRLLINATYFPGASPQFRAELQQVIDSIQIEP